MSGDVIRMTVGRAKDGRKIAILSSGGHPQIPNSGDTTILTVEVVDGWGKKKLDDWYKRMLEERPWETRQ